MARASFLMVVLPLLAAALPSFTAAADPTFRIVGYIPEYRHWDSLERWDEVLTDLTDAILFSIEASPSGELRSLDRLPSRERLNGILKIAGERGTNVLVCLGGAGRSDGVAEAIADEASRNTLVRNLADLVESRGLQGVDVDFEASGHDLWGPLGTFLRGLKRELGSKLVTLAYHPGQEALLLEHSLLDAVDFVSNMAYDNLCHVPRTEPPCRHSTLEFAELIAGHVQRIGMDASKVLLGVPAYGRHVMTGEAKPYYEIAADGDVDADVHDGYYFNGLGTLRAKVDLVRKAGLAGLMVWEVGQDVSSSTGRSLLSGLAEYVRTETSESPSQRRRRRRSRGRKEEL